MIPTLLAATLLANALAADPAGTPVTAVRGLATSVPVRYDATLRAKSEQSPTTPILLRVSGDGKGAQQIEFIGSVAGSYDLRDYLEREDGQPLAGLAPLPVAVVSTLPANHGTDLYDSGEPWFNWRAHYRELAWGAVAAWGLVPVAAIAWRLARRPRVLPPPPVIPPMTIEQQLRAALESADGRTLTIIERGQLELLVFRYFSQRLGLPELESADPASAYHAVREHADARDLVLALERWLHARGGEETARHAADALTHLRTTRLATPAGVAP